METLREGSFGKAIGVAARTVGGGSDGVGLVMKELGLVGACLEQ